jgi:predicted DNA binding CopG/RHH family protein
MTENKIRRFASEDEERKFWGSADSTDYVDWSSAVRVVLPNLKPTQNTISLRLPAMMLAELKRLANKRDVPYQSLMKVFLAERLAQERRPSVSNNAAREKRMDYRAPDPSQLIKRVPKRELPQKHRRWTGNDANQRNHSGRIPPGENPVYLELRWKKDKYAAETPVGCFRIDVLALRRNGYLAEDPAGGIRLKFFHEMDGTVYLGRGIKRKKIPVGRA